MNIESATMPFPVQLKTPIRLDPVLLAIVTTLLFGGLVILASASISISDNTTDDPFFYVSRQAVAALIGGAAGFACLFIPIRFWANIGPLTLLVAFGLLVVVLVPGVGYSANGSTRWIRLGVLNLQASEPARLCLMIYLAGYLVRQNKSIREQFAGFLKPIVVLVLASSLLLLEPDLGAAIVLVATAFAMMFVAGARFRDFSVFAGLAVVAAILLVVTKEYRLERLTGFMDPWADPFDSGFQLTQSLIAIGRGEWFGVGLGDGVQKLFYLPDAHTDFVFAVFAEEFGLMGSLLLISLFAALLWRIFRIGMRAANTDRFFEAYLAIGIGTWLGLQAFINLGVNMGLLPTKGLTLPLVSYGRSSMIVALISIGILFRIHHELQSDSRPANRRGTARSSDR
ncbi:MAG: putative lipid II flippase FtsW [Proteobacteria bacterium]|nr:putative lipid II flippase FtsW [Pseudomonadota bacterium]MDA0992811.1 putative lipid II flippase FtsW [Pseudomonadota bacterium]